MLPVGFVNRVNQDADSVPLGHVDIIPMVAGVPGHWEHPQLRFTFGFFKGKPVSGQGLCPIRFLSIADEGHPQDPVIIEDPGRRLIEEMRLHGTGRNPFRRFQQAFRLQIQRHFSGGRIQRPGIQDNRLTAERIGFFLQGVIGKASGKVAVIQNPDFHIPLPGLVQNHIHVLPPLRAAEIRMRTAFDTDGAAVCTVNRGHHLPKGGLILPMLPEKGEDMVFFLIHQQGLNGFVHCF